MKKFLFLALFAVPVMQMRAQEIEPIEFINFQYQVKQIEEFMMRFNGQVSVMDSTDAMAAFYDRLFLFDEKLYYSKKEEIDTFINKCILDSARLRFENDNWAAFATCCVKCRGKKDTVLLKLKTEQAEKYVYHWVLAGAYGGILSLTPNKVNPGLKLSPTDNSLNFMSLNNMTTREFANILNIADSTYQVDCTTVFYTLVYNSLLQIEYVQKLQYVFYDILGYDFVVSFDKKEEAHAGWLIKEFRKHEK